MENKIIAFGDIHGCYKAAQSAVQLAEELQAQAIFLGDYVDRGPSAIETLRILIAAQKKHPDWVFLRGNHDQMLLDLINKKATVEDVGAVLGINFGYNQAAKSFEEWQQTSLEEQKAIFNFLNSLKLYNETENYIFCHAVLRNTGESIKNKNSEELIWNYNYEPLWEGKPFIHGHYPVKSPKNNFKGLNINTSCGYGGFLTGIIINEASTSYVYIKENGEFIS
jgi:serine/threonine protein phosphatase 1